MDITTASSESTSTTSEEPTSTTSTAPVDTRVPVEFLQNGDFSNGLAPWTPSLSDTAASYSVEDGAVKFVNPSRRSDSSSRLLSLVQPLSDLDTTQTYTLTFSYRFDAPSIGCAVYTYLNNIRILVASNTATDVWLQGVATVQPTTSSAPFMVRLVCTNPGTVYLDNVSLVGKALS